MYRYGLYIHLVMVYVFVQPVPHVQALAAVPEEVRRLRSDPGSDL